MSIVEETDLLDALNAELDPPRHIAVPRDETAVVSIFGVKIANLQESAAIKFLEQMVKAFDGRSQAIYFVNAHTLNFAVRRPEYRALLNRASYVFGDGTGVRWAARYRGMPMKANLNGTDLVPRLFLDTADRGYRYFLLGATPDTVALAADMAQVRFPGWTLAGYHHGYLDEVRNGEVIEQINAARPHLLLVGMGNPLQEQWIDRNLTRLHVPLCMGTGGLFDHWAGNIKRAPRWVRRLGCEWLQLLLQQPHKWRRYLLGNPAFLYRMAAWRNCDIASVRRDGD
jgi:N-acetylglucosaminyldiphosphoundecaprenol N-acetyl-beta-D-mannosaminyltransferase